MALPTYVCPTSRSEGLCHKFTYKSQLKQCWQQLWIQMPDCNFQEWSQSAADWVSWKETRFLSQKASLIQSNANAFESIRNYRTRLLSLWEAIRKLISNYYLYFTFSTSRSFCSLFWLFFNYTWRYFIRQFYGFFRLLFGFFSASFQLLSNFFSACSWKLKFWKLNLQSSKLEFRCIFCLSPFNEYC